MGTSKSVCTVHGMVTSKAEVSVVVVAVHICRTRTDDTGRRHQYLDTVGI